MADKGTDEEREGKPPCRVTGPDGDGFYYLERTETNGAWAMIELGCCDPRDLAVAFADFLERIDFGELVPDRAR